MACSPRPPCASAGTSVEPRSLSGSHLPARPLTVCNVKNPRTLPTPCREIPMVHIPSAAATHHIDRRIYGQFAEHLGRSIYEGVWVGAESGIPNKNGIRTDVVDALRHIKVPLVRWPGGCFADEYHWLEGRRTRASADGQHALGRGGRAERVRHARVLRAAEPARRRGLHQRQRRQRDRRGDARLDRVHDARQHGADGRAAQAPRARAAVEGRVLRRRQRELGMRRQHAAAALREPVPPVPDLRPAVRRVAGDEDRVRCERR